VQIFSLLANNAEIFDKLVRIMTVSPFLGRALAERRRLIEALIEMSWPSPTPTAAGLEDSLRAALGPEADFEAGLNVLRQWAGQEIFDVAAQLAVGAGLSPDAAAGRFTAIAETVIRAARDLAAREIGARHVGGAAPDVRRGRREPARRAQRRRIRPRAPHFRVMPPAAGAGSA